MTKSIRDFIVYVIFLVILQVPMLHDWVVYDVAFPFQYIGLILLLRHDLGRGWVMTTAFVLGLILDIFSNTPGIHSSVSVFIAYIRLSWLGFVTDLSDEDMDVSLDHMGIYKLSLYLLPLMLVHHLMIFIFENEGFDRFWYSLIHAFWSTLLSFSIIMIAVLITFRRKRRA